MDRHEQVQTVDENDLETDWRGNGDEAKQYAENSQ